MKREFNIVFLVTGAVALTALAALSGGCSPKLDANEDAVLYYIRGASVHGKVRRIWLGGQTYVNKMLEARARYVKHLAALTGPLEVNALWDWRDSRWHKKDAIQKRERALSRCLSAEQVEAQYALDDLTEVARNVPAELGLEGEAKAIFLRKLVAAMSYNEVSLDEMLADAVTNLEAYHALFVAAEQCAANDDNSNDNIADNDACMKPVFEKLMTLKSEQVQARNTFIDEARLEIQAIAPDFAIAAKRSLKRVHLENRLNFLRHESKAYLQAARSQLDKVREEYQALATPSENATTNGIGADIPSDLATRKEWATKKEWVEDLENDVTLLKKNIDAVNAAYGAAKSDSSSAKSDAK